MKKFFMILGVMFLCLIILGAIIITFAAIEGTRLDKESKAYVDKLIPQIVSSWNADQLLNQASPELMSAITKDKLEALFKIFIEKLGAYKEYKGAKGDSLVNVTTKGKLITAAYIAEAVFGNTTATIKIKLIKHKDKWQVLEFYVNSPIFIP